MRTSIVRNAWMSQAFSFVDLAGSTHISEAEAQHQGTITLPFRNDMFIHYTILFFIW